MGGGFVDGSAFIDNLPEPREDVAVAEVGKALRGSRLFYGTHSDRWLDQEWQQEFWTEAAQIALDALASLIAERERAATVEAWDKGHAACTCVGAFAPARRNIHANPYRADRRAEQ